MNDEGWSSNPTSVILLAAEERAWICEIVIGTIKDFKPALTVWLTLNQKKKLSKYVFMFKVSL